MEKIEGITNVNFEDEKMFSHLRDERHQNHKNITNYILFLSICHTVLVEEKGTKKIYNVNYLILISELFIVFLS
jgi:hypothetical protein